MDREVLYSKTESEVSRLRQAWPFWCFLAVLLLSFFPAWLDVLPQRDVAFRYAPMAEAFRDCDFVYAFHPRTGFLHTFIAGIIAWTLGCSGFLACKISSLVFMSLSVFPLYGLMRRVYSRAMAEICTFVFVLASQLQHLGWSGLRDAHKCFLILLAAWALLTICQERKKWTGYLWLGTAAGLGVVTRGDLVLYMSLVFFWGIVLEMKLKSFPWRSLAGSAVLLAFSLPAIVLNWYIAGVAVPEIRFAWLFQKAVHRYPGLTDTLPLMAAGIAAGFLAAFLVRRLVDAGFGKWLFGAGVLLLAGLLTWRIFSPEFYLEISVRSYFGAVLKGFFPVYAIVGLVGIGVRLVRKEWTKEESILAGLLFGHAILVCSQVILNDGFLYVSSRYLVPAVPLEFAWSVTGILFLWGVLTGWVRKKHPRLVTFVGCTAFSLTVCGFLYDYYNPLIRDYLIVSPKQHEFYSSLRWIADVIRRDYQGPAEFRPEVDPGLYIPKYNPRILFLKYREWKNQMTPFFGRLILSAYLARGSVTDNLKEADYIVELYSEKDRLPPGLVLMQKNIIGKEEYRIWKWKRGK